MGMPIMWLILGAVALLLGLAMMAGWFDWLLRVGGIILIFGGIIAIIFGMVKMFSGNNRDSQRF